MFSITTKNLLVFSNILIFIAVKVNSTIISLEKLSLGDTIDKKNSKESAVVYGNIINFNDEIPFIVKPLTKSVKNPPTWSIIQSTCSKALNSHYNDKPVDGMNSFEVFDKRKLSYKSFDIDKKYLNNNHTCVLFELCESEKQTYKEFVGLFDENRFEKYHDDYYYYDQGRDHRKHVDILKFIRGDETHYVSSINSGDCLFQIFIFNTESKRTSDKPIDYSKETPQYTSKIVMASNNHTLEDKAIEYLNNLDDFLFNFSNYPSKIQGDVLNYLVADNIMSIELTALPKLPRSLEAEEINTEEPKERSNFMELQPGNSFNINDIKSDSTLVIGHLLDFMVFNHIEYKNLNDFQVTNYFDVNMEKSSLLCSEFTTKHFSNDNKKSIEILKPFDCWLEENLYGIDEKFFNENYKRAEIKICQILEEQKIEINPLEIVYLNEKSIDLDYNVFENENVILRFSKGNETHYVSSIQIGDCLYQALVFNSSEDSDKKMPVHKGKILSASRDSQLEQTIEAYLNKDSKSDNSLYQIYYNEAIRNEIVERLDKKAVVNLNLRSIYERRSLPLADLNEYHSFKSSTENSSVKNSEILSQELVTAVFQNLSQPNEAFKIFTENLFTAMFKNLSQDLFPGVLSNLSHDSIAETPKNSSQDLVKNSSNSFHAKTLKKPNSSNILQPSILSITINLTISFVLFISLNLISFE